MPSFKVRLSFNARNAWTPSQRLDTIRAQCNKCEGKKRGLSRLRGKSGKNIGTADIQDSNDIKTPLKEQVTHQSHKQTSRGKVTSNKICKRNNSEHTNCVTEQLTFQTQQPQKRIALVETKHL